MDRIKIKNIATIRPVPAHKQKGVIKHKPLTDEEILARGWSLERAHEIRDFIKGLADERRAKTSSPRKNGKNASAA